MTKAAFQAAYTDWKLIRTRGVVQVVFEVPIERSREAYDALGGMPTPASEVWCAIARLNMENAQKPRPSTPKPPATGGAHHKSWHEMTPAQQAGILCAEPTFWKFCEEWLGQTIRVEDQCIFAVREYCGVQSRKEIDPNGLSGRNWRAITAEYRAWMREPEVV